MCSEKGKEGFEKGRVRWLEKREKGNQLRRVLHGLKWNLKKPMAITIRCDQ